MEVTFKINRGGLAAFNAPQFPGFRVAAGPFQSSYTQIINGRSSQSFSVTYVLIAEQEGTYTIKPASGYIGSKKIYSNSLQITVTKSYGNYSSGKSSSGNSAGGNSSFNSKQTSQANRIIGKNLFMRLSVNKQAVRQGEPVYAVYKLYANPALNVLNILAPKMPVYDGFWATEINIPQITYTSSEVIGGTRYRVAELKKVVLFPTRSGQLVVRPLDMDFTIRLASGSSSGSDPWSAFFDDPLDQDYEDFRYHASSGQAVINVSKLPASAPADFVNAVGKLNFFAEVNKHKVKTNEPVTLRLKISGIGNLSLIESPQAAFPTDFEQFDPKTVDLSSVTPGGIDGSRTFEYVLIPHKSGKFVIPSVRFVYFDPSSNKYVTESSAPITIEVEKGVYSGSYPSDLYSSKSSSSGVIKDNSHLSDVDFTSPFLSGAFLISLGAMILAFVLICYYKKKKYDRENIDEDSLDAEALIRLRFTSARQALRSGDDDQFYDELETAVRNYLEKYYPANNEEEENPADSGENHFIIPDEELSADANQFLAKCAFARYAPKGAGKVSPEKMLSEAAALLKKCTSAKRKEKWNSV